MECVLAMPNRAYASARVGKMWRAAERVLLRLSGARRLWHVGPNMQGNRRRKLQRRVNDCQRARPSNIQALIWLVRRMTSSSHSRPHPEHCHAWYRYQKLEPPEGSPTRRRRVVARLCSPQ
jgi:hypothetical protein